MATSNAQLTPALKPSPEDKANSLSLLFFQWVAPLLSLARKKRRTNEELEDHEVWDLPKRDHTTSLTKSFDENWRKHLLAEHRKIKGATGASKATVKGSSVAADGDATDHFLGMEIEPAMARTVLYKTLKSLIGSDMIKAGVAKFFNSSVQFAYPLMISGILKYVQSIVQGTEAVNGWYFVGGLAISASMKALLENHYFFFANRAGWQSRSAITTAVYRKSLRLATSSRQTRTVGEIVNIMQVSLIRTSVVGLMCQ
jgi:ATP-binding cassette subfamily C (CFTR/MRP) protein 1